MDRVRDAIRVLHYSPNTEDSYTHWIRRYILFHQKRHPLEMSEPEICQFLTHLAVNGHVAANTQNVALSAILFLYNQVLHKERIEKATNATYQARIPAGWLAGGDPAELAAEIDKVYVADDGVQLGFLLGSLGLVRGK